MERLPVEILSHIFLHATERDIVALQLVSRKFKALTRDSSLWKAKCFHASYQERKRQRHRDMANNLTATGRAYAPILQAMLDLAGPQASTTVTNPAAPNAETETLRLIANERARALANWDPAYPDEEINYYEEYIHRHAPISISWFEKLKEGLGEEKEERAATGMGILYDSDMSSASMLVGALDDGSVGVWDLRNTAGRGRLMARSSPHALTGINSRLDDEQNLTRSKAQMTETGAVECVSIDSGSQKGYFGVMNSVVEMDLRTMQTISTERYPFPVTALSEAKHSVPLTIGTNMTMHLYDPRQRSSSAGLDSNLRCELIGGPVNSFRRVLSGNVPTSHAALSQPGPLSILHMSEDRPWDGNGSIWVAGRFTSLLNYDRRFFPRIRGTMHSGSRISCLRALPHPFLPREMGQMRNNALSASAIRDAKSIPGHTIIAAGEYRGKGALELYGLSSNPEYTTLSSDTNRANLRNTSFQNRQTVSRSKLFSVTPHGGSLAYSDGDGNVKWMERDGFSPIRTWNINEQSSRDQSDAQTQGTPRQPWDNALVPDDIVQLMLPTMPNSTYGHEKIGEDNLVVWTGEGKLGLLGFGKEKWDWSTLEEDALAHEEQNRRKFEREYAGIMGRALRRQADEMHFVRNLGMGLP